MSGPGLHALISGGAGFIGSFLADHVLARGGRVTAIDNLSVGRLSNVQHLLDHPNFRFITSDVTEPDSLREIVATSRPDIIFHLAAIHLIPYCTQHPVKTLHINVVGTQSMLEAARLAPIRAFVFTSSADVYRRADRPHKEDDPLEPPTVYGLSKLFCEDLVRRSAAERPETIFTIVRGFNVYGPRETNAHIVPQILVQSQHGGAVKLGNVSPLRDFVYVTDMAAALAEVAELKHTGRVEAFNIGSGEGTSVAEIVRLIGGLRGKPLTITQDPERVRKVERPFLVAELTKITAQTGWRPTTSLIDGLRATVQGGIPEFKHS